MLFRVIVEVYDIYLNESKYNETKRRFCAP